MVTIQKKSAAQLVLETLRTYFQKDSVQVGDRFPTEKELCTSLGVGRGTVREAAKAAGAAGWGVHGFVHGKLYEVEQENVGTEGAHRSELAGEVVLRHGSRFVKRKVREHPARAVSRAEAKYQKAAADYWYFP